MPKKIDEQIGEIFDKAEHEARKQIKLAIKLIPQRPKKFIANVLMDLMEVASDIVD